MKVTVDSLLKETLALLEEAKPSMIETLKPFSTRPPETDLLFACFELFHMQDYSLNWNTFRKAKDPSGTNILNSEYNSYTGDEPKSVLPKLNDHLNKTFEPGDVFNQAEGEDFTERHEKQILEWFKQCWYQAGGKQSKIPTYFSLDKEYIFRDIETEEVLEETEVAKRLGFKVG